MVFWEKQNVMLYVSKFKRGVAHMSIRLGRGHWVPGRKGFEIYLKALVTRFHVP